MCYGQVTGVATGVVTCVVTGVVTGVVSRLVKYTLIHLPLSLHSAASSLCLRPQGVVRPAATSATVY